VVAKRLIPRRRWKMKAPQEEDNALTELERQRLKRFYPLSSDGERMCGYPATLGLRREQCSGCQWLKGPAVALDGS